jgi:UDP-N-acetylmuramate--alanine ligase
MSDSRSFSLLHLPDPPARVHFVGIGGIGMSGLARIFLARGYQVSGSDAQQSAQTDSLQGIGIPVSIGHSDIARAQMADLVVATAAVSGANPEVDAARAANRPIIKRAAALGALANARTCVAVAGSHGKSTTSGMITTAMLELGLDPSYAVGAVVAASGVNASPGTGPVMIAEADEYDHSFLELTPDVAIITNVEFDHPDIFRDQADYDRAFCRFIELIRPNGTLVMSADDAGCQRLLNDPDFKWPARIAWIGESERAGWRLLPTGQHWRVITPDGHDVALKLQVLGKHNALNATAAMAAMAALGIDPFDATRGLAAYAGVGRRFDLKGEIAGVTVVDDYAHHPTEIRATIAAARDRYAGRRLWAMFQPHTYSRTRALLHDWPVALAGADCVGLLDIYAAREQDDLGVSSDDIAGLIAGGALRASTPAEMAAVLAPLLAPGDVVLTMGAGDITQLGPLLIDRLSGVGA